MAASLHKDSHCNESALSVQAGVDRPDQINSEYLSHIKALKKDDMSVEKYVADILSGNRVSLSKAITLVESSLPTHQEKAQLIIEQCLPHAGKSIRIGITGVPGAGKSTTIEVLGKHLTSLDHNIAVLAIDPSSQRTKGSILGDKTRMEDLSTDPRAFIRPSPSSGSLGGVARKTRETIILCEAAGFDVIIIETVGVGQSEIAVHSMVDFFLLIQLANTGDELQGIKRGIMEMADLIAINKAEGDNLPKAELAATQYKSALHLFPMPESNWPAKVLLCSAYTQKGIPELWKEIIEYCSFTKATGYFSKKRQQQNIRILYETIDSLLKSQFNHLPNLKEKLHSIEESILSDKISGYVAAQKLVEEYLEFLSRKTAVAHPSPIM